MQTGKVFNKFSSIKGDEEPEEAVNCIIFFFFFNKKTVLRGRKD